MATKWGIVGAGTISHDFASAISTEPGEEHQIVAIASRDLTKAKEFAKKFDIPKVYGSYEELANDSEVEIAYIGLVNPSHCPVAKLMLSNGKHAVIETAMAMNAKQVVELAELAKSQNRFLMEGLWSRFLPSHQFVMEQISSGKIGDVRQINADFGVKVGHLKRVASKETGGGTVLDIAMYALSLILLVFKEKPEQVKAVGHLNSDGVDESVAVAMKFPGGKTATVSLTFAIDSPQEAVIVGTSGWIKILKPFLCSEKVMVNDQAYDFPFPAGRYQNVYDGTPGLRYEAREIRRCLKAGLIQCPGMTHQDSLAIAEIQDEIRRQIGVRFDCD